MVYTLKLQWEKWAEDAGWISIGPGFEGDHCNIRTTEVWWTDPTVSWLWGVGCEGKTRLGILLDLPHATELMGDYTEQTEHRAVLGEEHTGSPTSLCNAPSLKCLKPVPLP